VFHADANREDRSLRYTMIAIRDRLRDDLEIQHPVLDEPLTNGPDDARAKFFRSKLEDAVSNLEVLDKDDCTQKEALEAWDKVFSTEFFSARAPKDEESESESDPVSANILIAAGRENPRETHKDGGGRYA
jgi:hypothetical protein